MSSAALSRGWRKGARTLVQTVAGGGLTALVTVLAGGLSPGASVALMAAFTALSALAQNWLESSGVLPVLLPTAALVPVAAAAGAVLAPVAGAVEAVADEAGNVVGTVTDLAGDVVGTVGGHVTPEGEETPS